MEWSATVCRRLLPEIVIENGKHSVLMLQVAADQEPVLEVHKEPILQAAADQEPALEAAKEGTQQQPQDREPAVETVGDAAVQAAADKELAVQADEEAITRTHADAAPVLKDKAPGLKLNGDSDSIEGRYIPLLHTELAQ